jgi:hypothetical protein
MDKPARRKSTRRTAAPSDKTDYPEDLKRAPDWPTMTADQRAFAAYQLRQNKVRRGLCTFLRFWAFCATRGCKRARACVGDQDACFARFWPQVPEEAKIWLRTAITARAQGRTPEEASRIGDAQAAQFNEMRKGG